MMPYSMKYMVLIMWMALLLIGALTRPADAEPADGNRRASVVVHDAAELAAAVVNANGSGPREIILADGEYTLDQLLWIDEDDVTVRSQSGNRGAVVIRGAGMTGGVSHIFDVGGQNFTCRDMTLRDVSNHAIQIHGELDADGAVIQNIHILDAREQMIKVSYDSVNTPTIGADNGVVEDCLLEYSAGIGPQWYIGGVDAHFAKDWIIRDNTFRYIR
ncbi:MAG: hypothetical protein GY859_17690, partial [Desulfobacterales bacterium]|nr:hypothetical protein [Desulfobacterales bacterium]